MINLKLQSRHKSNIYIFLLDPSFQEVNRLFVLFFEDKDVQVGYTQDFLQNVK